MPVEPLDELKTEARAPSPPAQRTFWQRITNSRFLFISIALHVIGALIATAWVVQTYSANRKLTFKGGPPSPNKATRAIEHKVQMAQKQKTTSAPAVKRIVSTGMSKVTLPEMPAMPKAATQPTKMAGAGGASFGAAGEPMGAASSQAGGGPVSMFGFREAKGVASLTGTFYDLKQTKDSKPNNMAIAGESFSEKEKPLNKSYEDVIDRFVKGGFAPSALADYFQGPTPLYNTQIFIPKIDAQNGPSAFNLGGRVQPRRWIVVYRGKVVAPEDGHYRFLGIGDDLLVVRFNGTVVLDAGAHNASGIKPNKDYHPEGLDPNDAILGVLHEGEIFEAKAGNSYPIEVLIGEEPGGQFKAFLLISKEGAQLPQDNRKNPKFPVFKMAPSNLVKPNSEAPVFSPDTSWSVWKGG